MQQEPERKRSQEKSIPEGGSPPGQGRARATVGLSLNTWPPKGPHWDNTAKAVCTYAR